MPCLICERENSRTFYNLGTTTMHSSTSLRIFAEKIVNTPLNINENDESICEFCYISLNDIDYMEKKIKEITQELRKRYEDKHRLMAIGNECPIKDTTNEDLELRSESSIEIDEKLKTIHFSGNNDFKDILNTEVKLEKLEELGKSCRNKNRPMEIANKRPIDNTINDQTNIESQSELPIDTEDGKLKTIHFSDNHDLKNILNTKFKEESDNSEEECKVDILYDMMDEKVFEIVIAKNNVEKKHFECSKCSQIFPTNEELKAHSTEHSEKKPFICEICGKNYRYKTALDIHVGMHRGINPFKCWHCNKTFTQKGALRRHVKIHTGEKPFQCEECGKCFTHHTSFNIHKKSHSGEKSYKCEICNLALISTSHLKRHMRVHTGEKKYSCSTCGKRFAERYNLVSHQKLHSNIRTLPPQRKKFKCEVSHALFANGTDLGDHLKKTHNC